MLVTIDPGTDACGVALWRNRDALQAAALVRAVEYRPGPLGRQAMAHAVAAWLTSKAPAACVQRVVIEMPQTYGGMAAEGDANDLIALGATVGAIEQVARVVLSIPCVDNVAPSAWKGGIKKPKRASDPEYVVIGRCRKYLQPDEWARIEWPRAVKLSWDVADAVGIGLRITKRWEK